TFFHPCLSGCAPSGRSRRKAPASAPDPLERSCFCIHSGCAPPLLDSELRTLQRRAHVIGEPSPALQRSISPRHWPCASPPNELEQSPQTLKRQLCKYESPDSRLAEFRNAAAREQW